MRRYIMFLIVHMHIVHFISFIFSCITISVYLHYYSILSSWWVKNSQRRRLSGSGGVWVFVPMSFCVVSHLSGDVSISSWRWWRRRCSGEMAFDCSAGFALECWTLFNSSPVLSWGPGIWTCQHWPCCFMVLHASQMSNSSEKFGSCPLSACRQVLPGFCCEIFQVVHKQC